MCPLPFWSEDVCARALLKEPWLRPSLRKMGQWEGLRLMLILGRGCRRCGRLCSGFSQWPSTGLRCAGRGKWHTMPQRRRRPRHLCASRARPTGGFRMATAGQPRQCYQRSIRNPARASRSFNSVIRLSLAGTMFATVVTRRWSSLTVRHGWLAVRSVAYFMEERPVASGRIGDVLPGHFRATSPCAYNVTWAVTPHFSGASRVPHTFGSQCSPRVAGWYQWRRNDWPGAHPQRSGVRWGVVGLPLLSNQIGASSGPTSPPRWFGPSAGTHQCVLQCDMCSLLTFTVLFAWTWNQVSASSTSFGRCGVSGRGFRPPSKFQLCHAPGSM